MLKNKDVSDLIIIFIKWKKFLIGFSLLFGIIAYLSIYFFIDEQYDSKALIIPSEDSGLGGIAGMFSELQGLPMGLGASNPDINLFTNIIYSRTMMEEVIDKFDLVSIYKLDTTQIEYLELAIEILAGSISAEENEFTGYEITVRTINAKLSADITNFLIRRLNEKLINLNVRKAKENREFLGKRLIEVKQNLKESEDSLNIFQKKTKVFNAEEQIKGTILLMSELQSKLLLQETQLSVYKKILPDNSPQLKNTEVQVEEYKSKLKEFAYANNDSNMSISIEHIPDYGLEYFRILRDIEINTKMLQFILPLYEQARFDEQKKLPVLRVIDYGVPAEKKSYPPRAILTIIITMGIFVILFLYVAFLENESIQNSEKYKYIKTNLFRWSIK